MDLFIAYWQELATVLLSLIGTAGALKWKFGKYIDLAKEIVDVFWKYKDATKDGVFTDQEKIEFATEVEQAVTWFDTK